MKGSVDASGIPRFSRKFFESGLPISRIGDGAIGGKAAGLAFIDAFLKDFPLEKFPDIAVGIPVMVVLTTELFDAFLERNHLRDIALSDAPDEKIARAFQKAEFPTEYTGDLMALISGVHSPLAVRSSSLLEDALGRPFAGVYATKMIPNNQFEARLRFEKLIEAVKLVWASTFFKEAKTYVRSSRERTENEKMAVIVQEVVGLRRGDRHYPDVSGVARSFNFYPMERARPEQGVVSLALGLGKTVVDGGAVWTYSPALPKANPPFGTAADLLKFTQLKFWAVHMGEPPEYDPIRETEYMTHLDLDVAEKDGTLGLLASTYDPSAERLTVGIGRPGPRVLTFAPLLQLNQLPLNDLVATLLKTCQDAVGDPVEIEFALTIDREAGTARLGFLQVRPMVVSNEPIEIADEEMKGPRVLAASEKVMGNGEWGAVHDVVYVKPDVFEARNTPAIAMQLDRLNAALSDEARPYVLIGFGRFGSADPWLGIPVVWSQINGARTIVEATLPAMNVDLSQGSHFFHNLSSFQVGYFSVPHATSEYGIDWNWLGRQAAVAETEHVRHVRVRAPLTIRIDGRTGRGVILHE